MRVAPPQSHAPQGCKSGRKAPPLLHAGLLQSQHANITPCIQPALLWIKHFLLSSAELDPCCELFWQACGGRNSATLHVCTGSLQTHEAGDVRILK